MTRTAPARRARRGAVLAAASVLSALAAPLMAQGTRARALPPSTLAVRAGEAWHVWWRAERASARWDSADTLVARAVAWRTTGPGVELGELQLAGSGEAWRTRVLLVRVDPARVRLALATRAGAGGAHLPWTIDDAPVGALLAVNAGQFDRAGPWGWVVLDGVERRAPGAGALAAAVTLDTAGRLAIVPADSIAAARGRADVREAFQSYPLLLGGRGEVPPALRRPGSGVDLAHRDARLALGVLRDGRVLLALTRFDALGGALDELPFGLTTPETAALMGALGCARAIMLDGGISAQLRVRDADGEAQAWHGLRAVPLGLVGVARTSQETGVGSQE